MAHSDKGILGHQSCAVVSTLTRIAGRTTGGGVGAKPVVVDEERSESSLSGGGTPTAASSSVVSEYAKGAGVISSGSTGEGVAKYLSHSVSP